MIRKVTVKGPARERGQMYGETLRCEIAGTLALFEQLGGISAESAVCRTGLLGAAERWTPELVEEVRGIAEGANLPFAKAFALQFSEEIGWLPVVLRQTQTIAPGLFGCSTIGVFDPGFPTLLAQNWDASPDLQGQLVIRHAHHQDSDLEVLSVAWPGCLGPLGLNNKGIGVTGNSLANWLTYSPDGLPLTFVLQGVLARRSHSEAVRFLHEVNHASPEANTIGSSARIEVYECSANQVRLFEPQPGYARTWHTNHPLVNDDIVGRQMERLPEETQRRIIEHSGLRLQYLSSKLRDAASPVTVEDLKALLGSHDSPSGPVCNHPGTPTTVASLIMTLSGTPELRISDGPPCTNSFEVHRF